MRATRLSIVPTMDEPPPTPLRVVLSSLALWLLVLLIGATLLGFIAPGVSALPGWNVEGVLRLAAAQAVAASIALLVGVTCSVWLTLPIYRTLRLGSRVERSHAPAPKGAILAGFHLPERVVWGVSLAAQSVALADALGWIHLSGLAGWPRVAIALLALALAAAGIAPSIILYRAIVWRWLGRLHPDDIPEYVPRQLANRLALAASLPVGMVGLAAFVVLQSHLVAFRAQQRLPMTLMPSPWWTDVTTPAAAAALAMAATLATWLLVRRAGMRTASDLSRLEEEIIRVQRRGRPSTRAQLAVFEIIPRTPEGAALGRVLAELAGRFSEMAEKEQHAARAMEGVRKLRTQFLASMSHDLRNPLNTIAGFANLMACGAEGPLTSEQHESVQMVHRSARELLRLVNHILDWARLDAGRFEVAPDRVNVRELLDDVLEEAGEVLDDAPVELRAEFRKDVAALDLHVDRRRVTEAMIAIFEHAASTMQSGEIWLRADIQNLERAPALVIRVTDRGPGVRPTDTERMFQAFREIQDPTGKRVGGLGVGLAVAREVVRAHDGDLTLHSSPGQGSTFELRLPLPESHVPPPRVKTIPPPPP